jgi:putative intracellular protease/amidase
MTMNALILKVLIIVTSHNQLGNTGKPTGYYLPEVTHTYFELEKAGLQIEIASPLGGKAPMDEKSRDLSDPENKKFLNRSDLVNKIENTIPLSKVNASAYKAIIFAGGHGTMWDFPENKSISEVSRIIYENGGVVAAICHGPAALINIKLTNGQYLISGKKFAAFSNDEERAAKLAEVVPFLLETELVKRGGIYSKAALWQEHVVVSERLVTGQNPASAKALGKAVGYLLKPLVK